MQTPQNHSSRRSNEADYLPGSIKQRHLEAGAKLIFTGLEADLPSGKTHEKVFFAYDTNKLYIWNESSGLWVSVVLT